MKRYRVGLCLAAVVTFECAHVLAGASFAGSYETATSSAAQSEGTAMIDNRMWSVQSNGETIDWEGAIAYCEELDLGGFTDWRLPAIEVLESLYDPQSDAEIPIASPIRLDFCCLWSSTILEEDGDPRRLFEPSRYSWGFYFPTGIRYYSTMGFEDGQALCVREGG